MRIALLSDIHGNLQALRATLEDVHACRADRIVCLGDAIGYGADPDACAALLRGHEAATVLGNHDAAVIGKFDAARFNPVARAAIAWTGKVIRLETKEWLLSLPLKWCGGDYTLVHGSLDRPDDFPYVRDAASARACLDAVPFPPLFFGHTHKPAIWRLDTGRAVSEPVPATPGTWRVPEACACALNPGSVGQPRDGDPSARWLLYDTASRLASWRRVDYDRTEAARRIRAAGLPESLAERLFTGL